MRVLDIAFLSDEIAVIVTADRLIWVRRDGDVSETPLDKPPLDKSPLYTLRWRGTLYEDLALAIDDGTFYQLSFWWIMERKRELRLERALVERKGRGVRIRFEGSSFKWKRIIVAGSDSEGAPGLLRNVLVSSSGTIYGVAAIYEKGEERILSAWAPMTKTNFFVRIDAEPSLVLLSGTRLVISDQRGLLVGDISAGGLICIETIRAGDKVFRADQILGAGIAPNWTIACLTADGWLLYCRPGFEDVAFAAYQASIPESARLARLSPSLEWLVVVTDRGAMAVEIPRATQDIP